MAKRGGLGRGLDALMPSAGPVPAEGPGSARVHVEDIRPSPDQPRRQFDEAELRGLAESIRQHGLIQPLVVVREGGGYRLIAGERRLRAARLAGLTDVPVVMRDTPEGQASLALSLVENVQRHDLNALEEAEAYQRLVEDFGLTQEAVAREVGKSQAHVANTLRLLRLAPAVQGALLSGAISAGHARALAPLPVETQESVLRRVLRDDLNVRQTEDLVRETPVAAPARKRRGREQDPDTRALEGRFRDALQTRVKLTRRGKGGRLTIDFFSDEELDGLYRRIVQDPSPARD
jgi:ParB family chromosome partitioning protein